MLIDPTDIPPHRNLPGEAEQWGRVKDETDLKLIRAVNQLDQSQKASNRSTAATLANISRQLRDMPTIKTDTANSSGLSLLGTFSWSSAFDIPDTKDEVSIQTSVMASFTRTSTPTTARVLGYLRYEILGDSFWQGQPIIASNVGTQHTLNLSMGFPFSDLQGEWRNDMAADGKVYVTAFIYSDSPSAFGADPGNIFSMSNTATFTNSTLENSGTTI